MNACFVFFFFQWYRWALQDTGRAETPLSESSDDTFPVGIGICMNSTLTIKQGKSTSVIYSQ